MKQSDKNIDEYLQSLINKDERGVSKLYQDLFPKIKKYILSNSGTLDDAREVMQKALMQITVRTKVRGFTITSSFEGYLFVTCRNIWLREQKKRSMEVTNHDFSGRTVVEDIADSAVEQEKWDLFQEKFKELSDKCRELLGLFFKKISYKEIVIALGYASENTVKQRVFKCKAQIKAAMQADVRFKDLM